MMGKFTDDVGFVPAGQARQPVLAVTLFRKLGVGDAGVQDQAKALTQWLETNRPEPALSRSLDDAGFGYLLNDQGAA